MSKTFLYIHGFNSDGNGWKAKALEHHFPAINVIAPDFTAHPLEIIEKIKELIADVLVEDLTIWGSSYGGFFAYCLSAELGVPAILINPSLEPYTTLDDRGIGHFKTWTKKRNYVFKAAYLNVLLGLKQEADQKIDSTKLCFLLAEDDDVLDLTKIPERFPLADIRWYAKAGHGFSKFEKALKALKKDWKYF